MTRLRLNGYFGFAHFEPNLQWSLKHVKFDDMPAQINSNVVVPFPASAWMFHLKSHIFLSLLVISCDLNSLVFEFESHMHQSPVPVLLLNLRQVFDPVILGLLMVVHRYVNQWALLHKAFKDRVSLSYSNLRDNLGMRAPQLC